MGRLYDWYERRLFPRLLDLFMRPLAELRPDVIRAAEGDVLEIGFGTGLNLPHYGAEVTRLSTVDPMDALPAAARRRIEAASFPVELHHLRADGTLPFDAGRFDCATITWTLCTIPDPVAALREVRRVLKPNGPLHFIEHGRSDDPRVAGWQDRWNPIQNVIGCGCNVNRKMDALIAEAGFSIAELDRFALEGAPRVVGEMYRGRALASRPAPLTGPGAPPGSGARPPGSG
ncbi:MAG: class I SAM-dependent methyltransferase [Proteobacteria bacterium]|nr:class I SAM-dependent methyltransferase [Pseudomonadota bacterium]